MWDLNFRTLGLVFWGVLVLFFGFWLLRICGFSIIFEITHKPITTSRTRCSIASPGKAPAGAVAASNIVCRLDLNDMDQFFLALKLWRRKGSHLQHDKTTKGSSHLKMIGIVHNWTTRSPRNSELLWTSAKNTDWTHTNSLPKSITLCRYYSKPLPGHWMSGPQACDSRMERGRLPTKNCYKLRKCSKNVNPTRKNESEIPKT